MGLGVVLMELLIPVFELFLPIIPGDVFPYFFGGTVGDIPYYRFNVHSSRL